jgi:16S rRNA (guanine(966)-N(2))-methyltransferase RsmD
VTGGRLRGRRIESPRSGGTRPTSERARQALFDWLGDCVEGARVLDLFAGTGALGIEALSRGAESCVFVERDRRVARQLRGTLSELDLDPCTRLEARDVGEALTRLAKEDSVFDLVLADPPYSGDDRERLAKRAELVDILAPEGVLVVERTKRDVPVRVGELTCLESREYGETAFDWYERRVSPEEESNP